MIKPNVLVWFAIVLISISGISDANAQPCKEVVGYYAGWKWYKRNKLVNPETIDYSKYTILNYAFFKPLADGGIIEGDAWADKNILLGRVKKVDGVDAHDKKSSLVYRAHKNGVKVMVSIGGWTWSSDFPAIAANESSRTKFANSCVEHIQKYGFDGIDIDWEYPGHKAHNGTPDDKRNFTLLLSAIREALNNHGKKTNHEYLLTAAFGPSPVHMANIEWDEVVPLLDMVHLMTYNYYGAWDPVMNHNTPLYKPAVGSASYCIESSVNMLLHTYGVPSSKLTLGLAFYGRSSVSEGVAELHKKGKGVADAITFVEEKGTPSYYNILLKADMFEQEWDDLSKVPYLKGKNGHPSFVSFDNPESISVKVSYAIENNFKGVVIWDITGDYIETFPGSGQIAGTPLCDAVNNTFCNAQSQLKIASDHNQTELTAFPNPFRSEIEIAWNNTMQAEEIRIVNGSGELVFKQTSGLYGNLKLSTAEWAPGVYFISLQYAGKVNVVKVMKL